MEEASRFSGLIPLDVIYDGKKARKDIDKRKGNTPEDSRVSLGNPISYSILMILFNSKL